MNKKNFNVFFIIILVILLSIPIVMGIKVIFFKANTLDTGINTAYDVVNKTLDADNAIYNYEWFIEQESNIRVCLKNEEIAKEEWELFKSELPEDRLLWDKDDKQEESSLRNSYYALEKLTNLAIEKYNSRAEMVSRNIFKDNLPSNISRAFYAGKKLTN